ncbi:hypothetical protein LTR17_027105 [Elasticomyces elasticus]|nr:hypothetical protein LTR17_027105 [Elasticomyces elasticus]
MSSVKPIKMERTHEENQERAYIAASRRSDRGLEARFESAKRASKIHKQRTGRSLRVTEQDVINEEIYEEERDDLPTQYQRMAACLQNANADFNQRCQSYLFNHVPMPQAVDDAALVGMRTNCQLQSLVHEGSPPYMQAAQEQLAYRGSMMPWHMPNNTAPRHGHQPYPMPQDGVQKPTQLSYDSHGYPLSLTTPWDSAQSWQQRSQSAQCSPVNATPVDLQWMSPPSRIVLPIKDLYPQGQMISPRQPFPAMPCNCSVTNAPILNAPSILNAPPILNALFEQRNPSQQTSANTQQQPSLQPSQQESLTSPLGPSFDPQSGARMPPLHYDATCEVSAGHCGLRNQNMSIMFSQQRYSYNPNGKLRDSGSQTPWDGPNETSMAPMLDTSFGGFHPSSYMTSLQ